MPGMTDSPGNEPQRPPGHPEGLPWPPSIREYPPDSPARVDDIPSEPFNEEWAREDFGDDFVKELIRGNSIDGRVKFRGDWWVLAMLVRCAELALARDPEANVLNRFIEWVSFKQQLQNHGVHIHLEHAVLYSARLEHADLRKAHLEYANLEDSRLRNADLFGARLEYTKLNWAHLEHADLGGAHLEDADLSYAHLEDADLRGASLYQSNLVGARLDRANMQGSRLEHAVLSNVSLTGADVRRATGLRFDSSLIRGLHIEGNAPDPWSVLRRSYSGPWFFIHATFLLAFILPYIGKVLALTAADHARQSMGFVESTLPSFVHVEEIPAWRVLVGLERGWWVPVLGLILLVYNAIRGVLTVRVGMLRDAEERAGISPGLREYMGSQELEEESILRWLANLAEQSAQWIVWMAREYAQNSMQWLARRVALLAQTRLFSWVRPISRVMDRRVYAWRSQRTNGSPNSPPTKPPAPGLWRWHRLLKLLFWVAVLSFSIHAVDWVWNTTLPRVTVEKPAILEPFTSPAGMDRP